jgi:hypothetical protein
MSPEDVRRLVDIEADLDEGQLSQVRFGRRRFLRSLGLALFGVATGAVVAQREAEAQNVRGGCNRAPTCKGCRDATCTTPGCFRLEEPCCWRATSNAGGTTRCYLCCDWVENGKLCVCPDEVDCTTWQ